MRCRSRPASSWRSTTPKITRTPSSFSHAWQKFRDSPPEVACVQAPLEIANRGAGIVARMFAFEYAALFRGMLPWLSANRLLLPLGGTSNHFRRAVLEEVGGWDPYNVTEDADLGMRLARFGYRTETIACSDLRSRAPTPSRPGCRSAPAGSRAGCRPGWSTCAIPCC